MAPSEMGVSDKPYLNAGPALQFTGESAGAAVFSLHQARSQSGECPAPGLLSSLGADGLCSRAGVESSSAVSRGVRTSPGYFEVP